MLGRDDRDRLAEVADAVDREHGLVRELEPVRLPPGTSACVSTACTPGIVSAAEMSIERMRACACGLRSVWPQSIPAAERSLAYANSPVVFGIAVDALDALADAAELELRGRSSLMRSRRQPHASKIFA